MTRPFPPEPLSSEPPPNSSQTSSPEPPSRAVPPSAAGEAEALIASVRAHVADLLGEEDPEFVRDLVDTFCGSAHELVSEARALGAAGDLAGVGKVAHQLKGSASNVGLTGLESAWHRVETGTRSGDATVLGLPLRQAVETTARAAGMLANAA